VIGRWSRVRTIYVARALSEARDAPSVPLGLSDSNDKYVAEDLKIKPRVDELPFTVRIRSNRYFDRSGRIGPNRRLGRKYELDYSRSRSSGVQIAPCTNIIPAKARTATQNRTPSKSVERFGDRFTWHMSSSTSTSTSRNARTVVSIAADTSPGRQDDGTQTPQCTVESLGRRWPGCGGKTNCALLTSDSRPTRVRVSRIFDWTIQFPPMETNGILK